MGEPGSPIPPSTGGFGRATPSRRGMGKPGFPHSPTRGSVWEGCARPGTTFLSSSRGCAATPHGRLKGRGCAGVALPRNLSRALTFDRRGSIIQAAHHNLASNAVMRTSSPATAAREGASGTGSAPVHGPVKTTSERSPQRRRASMEIRAAPVTAPHEDALRYRAGIEDGWNHEATLRPIGKRGFLF